MKNTSAKSIWGLESASLPASTLLGLFCAHLCYYHLECLPGSFLQFRSHPRFSAFHSTVTSLISAFTKYCGIYQDFTNKSLWYRKWFLLLACYFQVPAENLDGNTWQLWLPFIQHALSRQSNQVGAFIICFQMRKLRLSKIGVGQTQAIIPKVQTLNAPTQLVSYLFRCLRFVFSIRRTCFWGWGLQTSLLSLPIYSRHGEKHIACCVNIVFQNARYMKGTICCS